MSLNLPWENKQENFAEYFRCTLCLLNDLQLKCSCQLETHCYCGTTRRKIYMLKIFIINRAEILKIKIIGVGKTQ